MNVKLEDAGPCRKIMHVEVPSEAVVSDYETVVGLFKDVVNVRGFRKGRAPARVVEQQFAAKIAEEAKDRLVPRFYKEALEQEGIKPVTIVSVSEVEFSKEQGLAFNVTLDVAPDIKLPKYKKLSLKRNKVEVADKEVAETLERIRESAAKFEDVEGRPVHEGDLVMADYAGQCEGAPIGEMASECSGLGEGKDFWLLVGEPEFLPGFTKGLVGISPGETRTLDVRFPDDYHVPAVAGKTASYTVTAKSVRERIPAEMDEAFLKRFEVDSVEALREKMRVDLLEGAEMREQARLKDEVAKFLLEKTKFDVPQSVVEQETNLAVRSIIQRSVQQGATKEQIGQQRDSILENATRTSTDRVKLSYVLSRIAEEEGVTVGEEDVTRHIEQMATRYGMAPDRMKAELEKREALESLETDIRAEKTMDFLLENAKIKG